MLEVLVVLLVAIALLVAASRIVGGLLARFLVRVTADFVDAVESARQRRLRWSRKQVRCIDVWSRETSAGCRMATMSPICDVNRP